MKKQKRKYRKAKKSCLKKEWYNHPKIEGGPCFPFCNCCNGAFGRPVRNNKKLIHRYIRRRMKQTNFMEELE